MFKKILVPSDFSNPQDRVFEVAASYATSSSSSVHLLHVIEILKDIPFEELKDFYQEIERSIQDKMKRVSAQLADKKVKTSSNIRYGNRIQEIVSACRNEHYDLLLLQSHVVNPSQPHEGWGTLSQRLAIVAPCSVLLVR